MARKSGLGKGLEALIPGSESPVSGGVREVPAERILPNPRQPRAHMDQDEMDELAASIREHGVIQPLIVTESDQPGQYILIAGERRLLAAQKAGLMRVPVVLREASDRELLELSLIENVQRADLSPLEAAEAYQHLAEDFKLSHDQIAAQVGKSRVSITNTLRLLNLAPEVKQALVDGRITEGHGRALLGLRDVGAQRLALETILDDGLDLTVRQTEKLVSLVNKYSAQLLNLPTAVQKALAEGRISGEHGRALLALDSASAQESAMHTILARNLDVEQTENLIRKLRGEKPPPRQKPSPPPEITDLENRLKVSLGGFPVSLKPRKQGGTIRIDYYSDEDLNTIVERILGDE